MSHASTGFAFLVPHPKSAYRQLFVKGTRIRARVLYGWYACADGMSPEEIAREYDLPVAAVREAIAYCESNPPELAEDYAREEELMRASGMTAADYKLHPQPLAPQALARVDRP